VRPLGGIFGVLNSSGWTVSALHHAFHISGMRYSKRSGGEEPPCGLCRGYTAGVYVVTTLCRAWWPLSHKSETDPDYVSLFVNLYSQYRVLDITCSERDSFLVHHSRCLLPLSLAHVIRLDEGLPKLLSIASISPFSHYQDL